LKILTNKPHYQILKQENHGLLEFYWLNHDQPMTSEDFKQGCKELTQYILQERPNSLLISYQDISYIIPYDMQLWFIEHEAPVWLNSSLTKIALVVDNNLLLHSSVLDVIEQSNEIFNITIEHKFFENKEKALFWLNDI
jgi:hypothetical protein